MRLWHQQLISKLPRQQLLGQHRECCALRGKGWGRKHSTVDYVFTHTPERLVAYHWHIMDEMEHRGYKPDKIWDNPNYRGKIIGIQEDWADEDIVDMWHNLPKGQMIYPEHNDSYLRECIENLKSKGIDIKMKPPRYYEVDPKDIKPGDEFSGYEYKPEKGIATCFCTVIVNEEGIPLVWGKHSIKEEVLFFHRDLTLEEQDNWFKINIDVNKDVNKLNLIGFHNDLYHIGDASHEMWNGWITASGWEEQLMALDGEDFFVVGVAPAPFSPDYFDNPVAIVIEAYDTGNRRWCHCEKDWIDNFREETKQFV